MINRGGEHGVTEGMYFAVMSSDKRLQDIKDPSTGAVLGSIPRETVRVQVSEVYDNMSVAETYDSYVATPPLSPLDSPYWRTSSRPKTYYQTLKKSRQYSSAGYEDMKASEGAVQAGDRVVEVTASPVEDDPASEADE